MSVLRLPRPLEKVYQQMDLSWTVDIVNVHDDAMWKALEMKTRLAEKFTDESGVKVIDEDGFCPTA